MKLWNVPIESLEERYSKQWNDNFPRTFNQRIMEWQDIYPKTLIPGIEKIRTGQFLDAINTNRFKAWQIAEICNHINTGLVKDGDVFFFHDLWFPGIEALFYIRDTTKINFHITGMLHAGSYDPWDYLHQCGLQRWAKRFEEMLLNEVDLIFVATYFHKKLLTSKRNITRPTKIYVTGFPLWDLGGWKFEDKKNIVVFPHRLAPEKAPEDFSNLAYHFSSEVNKKEIWFYKTKEHCQSKNEYFHLLEQSKVAVSFAKQETWGIAQQEAMFRGCIPLVPNRLSYPEMYNRLFLYKNKNELHRKLRQFINEYENIVLSVEFQRNVLDLQESNNQAVDTMLNLMRIKFLKGD